MWRKIVPGRIVTRLPKATLVDPTFHTLKITKNCFSPRVPTQPCRAKFDLPLPEPFEHNLKAKTAPSKPIPTHPGAPGGGTAIYGLYRYVPL